MPQTIFDPATIETTGRAAAQVRAKHRVTARPTDREGRANDAMQATGQPTAPPDPDAIQQLRQTYRLAKAAETTRIQLLAGPAALVRVHAAGWSLDADLAERKRTAAAAKRVVHFLMRRERPTVPACNQRGAKGVCSKCGERKECAKPCAPFPDVLDKVDLEPGDDRVLVVAEPLVVPIAPVWWRFEMERSDRQRTAEKIAKSFPAWHALAHISGFSAWGLAAIVGEAGDLGLYSGCRKLFKRLGLAPDECYPLGERRRGRKIPRGTRGRIVGILAQPLFWAQWRGEKDDVPARPIGPFGEVYLAAKARHLASGKSKAHADEAARRAMVKALLHDVHRAWHGRPLTYA